MHFKFRTDLWLKRFLWTHGLLVMAATFVKGLTEEERLRQSILSPSAYNPEALPLPATGQTKPTVQLAFHLLTLQHLTEQDQVLTTYAQIQAEWYDMRLKWSPLAYDNTTRIFVSPQRIWTPELAVVNAEKQMFLDMSHYLVKVSHTGHVTWSPAGLFETECDVDVTLYPYDYQRCLIKIGTWSLSPSEMLLTESLSTIQFDQYKPNGAWDILETAARTEIYRRGNVQYECVAFSIVMERIHTFYSIHLVLPSAAMAALVPMIFLTPAGSGEKITLGVSIVLAFSVFLLFAVDNLPESSRRLPVMGICLMFIMIISSSALILTIINLSLYHRPASRPMSRPLRWFVFELLAKCFCVSEAKITEASALASVCPQTAVTSLASSRSSSRVSARLPDRQITMVKEFHKQSPSSEASQQPQPRTKEVRVEPVGEDDDEIVVDHTQPKPGGGKQWQLTARILDKFFFTIASSAMCMMALALLVMVNTQTQPQA